MIAQRGCGVSLLGNLQRTPQCGPGNLLEVSLLEQRVGPNGPKVHSNLNHL